MLAPKPRSQGPDRLQAEVVDFSQNTRGPNRYGLVVTDVFTREVANSKALPNKQSGTVTQAAAEIIPELVQEGEGNYVVTTDQGNEFRGLEGALPEPAVHREKLPSDRNAMAVIDRAIQTLKKDLAGKVARDGGGWAEHVAEVTEAYNARLRRRRPSGCSGTTRRSSSTSFQPQYGPVREVAGYDSMTVRATDGSETLLKHALPVPGEPRRRLTRPPVPLAVRQLRTSTPVPSHRPDFFTWGCDTPWG